MKHLKTFRLWMCLIVLSVAFAPNTTPQANAAPNTACPIAWQFVAAPEVGYYTGLVGIDGVAENDLWAVGSFYDGSAGRTLIEHWDGAQWSIAYSPNRGAGTNGLHALKAVAANDVWALGTAGDESYLLRWNGTQWDFANLPTVTALSIATLDGSASNNVWIGGTANENPFAARWDGAQWIDMTPPEIPSNGLVRRSVVKDKNEIYVMASAIQEEGVYPRHNIFYMMKWDGSTWTTFGTFDFQQATHGWWLAMYDFTVIAPNDIWSMGYASDYVIGTILYVWHWNGTEWSNMTPPPDNGKFASLARIAHRAADSVWTVGIQERYYFGPADVGADVPLLSEWDGAQWTNLTTDAFEDNSALYDFAFIGNHIWAVGSAPDGAMILRGVGCADIPSTPKLRAPKNKAELAKNKVTLDWDDATGTLSAELQIQDGRHKNTRGTLVARHGAYKFTTPLEGGHKYRWRVRDCNTAGCGKWSQWRKFKIK